jgi:hypothetical protein
MLVTAFSAEVGRHSRSTNASGLRILHALAKGETDPKKLAQLGDERLQCTGEQLVYALAGRVQPVHREMLALQLQRLDGIAILARLGFIDMHKFSADDAH